MAAIIGDIPEEITATNLLGFVLLAVALTALPFVLWFRAILALGATSVVPFVLATPVVAFALDAAMKGVWPSTLQMVGMILVMAGLELVSQSRGERRGGET